jgi:hypothetical protein
MVAKINKCNVYTRFRNLHPFVPSSSKPEANDCVCLWNEMRKIYLYTWDCQDVRRLRRQSPITPTRCPLYSRISIYSETVGSFGYMLPSLCCELSMRDSLLGDHRDWRRLREIEDLRAMYPRGGP